MQKSKTAQLTTGSVGGTLVRLTIPMIFGILAMVGFNLVDTYFVGQLGSAQLAAMSFTFPVVLVIASVAMGIGVGTAAVISRAIGEGDQDRVRRLTTDSLVLSVIIVTALVSVGLMTIDPLFTLLGATPEIMPLIREYITLWYMALVVVVVPMVGNNAIRATGDTKTPSMIMLVAVAVNIVLDPILIFGWGPVPAMGLQGAAIATAVARAVTLAVSLWVLHYREQMLDFSRPQWAQTLRSWKEIMFIGLPAAATNMVVPLSGGVITSIVAGYGPEAVAALGVSSRLEMLTMAVIMALASVLGPFVGQNWGAGRMDRVKTAMRYSVGFAVVWGGIMTAGYWFSSEWLAGLFSEDRMVIQTTVLYLTLIPISYGGFGTLTLATTTLNVLNKPLHSAVLSVVRVFVLYVPLAYLGAGLFDLSGIFGAAAVANVAAGTAAFFVVRSIIAQRTADEADHHPAHMAQDIPLPVPAGAD